MFKTALAPVIKSVYVNIPLDCVFMNDPTKLVLKLTKKEADVLGTQLYLDSKELELCE